MATARRIATVDIGTNSVLLLVAEVRGGDLVPLVERATITRLGQDVDRTRALAPEAVKRTLACVERYADEVRALGVERVAVVGTSAMRDARGGGELSAEIRARLGVELRVVSGEEEARLTFEGALVGAKVPEGPVTVFDVGGGSTEIIAGIAPDRVVKGVSLDVGSVRLTERHVRSDPPSPAEIDAVRADVRAALAAVPRPPPGVVVGVAGTVTTLAAIAHDIVPYDETRVHGARLARDEVEHLLGRLASLPLAERRALPALDPGRADVIVAGCVIVIEILGWAPRKEDAAPGMIVSDRGVRWGLARRLAAELGD